METKWHRTEPLRSERSSGCFRYLDSTGSETTRIWCNHADRDVERVVRTLSWCQPWCHTCTIESWEEFRIGPDAYSVPRTDNHSNYSLALRLERMHHILSYIWWFDCPTSSRNGGVGNAGFHWVFLGLLVQLDSWGFRCRSSTSMGLLTGSWKDSWDDDTLGRSCHRDLDHLESMANKLKSTVLDLDCLLKLVKRNFIFLLIGTIVDPDVFLIPKLTEIFCQWILRFLTNHLQFLTWVCKCTTNHKAVTDIGEGWKKSTAED